MAAEPFNEVFQNKALPYNVRVNSKFSGWQVHSMYHVTESLSFLGPKVCKLVPADSKETASLEIFKNKF